MKKVMQSEKRENEPIICIEPSAEFYFKRGWKAFQKSRLHDAEKYFERAASFAQDEMDRVFGLCQVALIKQHQGNYQASADLLDSLIKEGLGYFPEVYYFQANNFAFLEDFLRALKYTQVYLYLEPSGDYQQEAEQFQAELEIELDNF